MLEILLGLEIFNYLYKEKNEQRKEREKKLAMYMHKLYRHTVTGLMANKLIQAVQLI